MSGMMRENDSRFPDESEVLVRYPLRLGPERQPGQSQEEHLAILRVEREIWPWLLGTVEQQCGPDEWLITIEDRRVAVLEDGSPAPEGTADDDLLFPQCYRDSSEIRPAPPAGIEAGPLGYTPELPAEPGTARLADSPGLLQMPAHQLGETEAREAGQ